MDIRQQVDPKTNEQPFFKIQFQVKFSSTLLGPELLNRLGPDGVLNGKYFPDDLLQNVQGFGNNVQLVVNQVIFNGGI